MKSITLFIVAGLLEIGGGYFVWRWWRTGSPLLIGVLGMVALSLYGIVPTYQPAHFGRVYAAYGCAPQKLNPPQNECFGEVDLSSLDVA
jgi:small multidrug resistance family-3 protein